MRFLERASLYLHGFRSDFRIAECYEVGQHVVKDIDTAIRFYRKAAKHGDGRAFLKLGQLYEQQGKLDQALEAYLGGAVRDNSSAREDLLRLATLGNVQAEYYLGLMSEHEQGWERAQEWYEKAIAKSYAYAMYRLGSLYQSDRISKISQRVVIEKNGAKELSWYKQAATLGCAHALDKLVTMASLDSQAAFYLAQLYESGGKEGPTKNVVRAIEYYEKSSSLGNRDAAFRLGQLYEGSELREARNVQIACKHYLVAASRLHQESIMVLERLLKESENAQLEYEFGEVYYISIKDKASALRWYLRAAENGHEQAIARLNAIAASDAEFAYAAARSYEEDNEKVARNTQKAVTYYVAAIRRNHEDAKKCLACLAASGNANAQYALGYEYYRVQNDLSSAVDWIMKAAEQKYEPAIIYLTKTSFSSDILIKIASMYERGEGVSKNMSRALEFYAKASALDDAEATFRLGQLYEDGNKEINQDRLKAYTYYALATRQNHPDAKQHLEQAALSGNADAQYALGFNYYHQKGEVIEATRWCVSAEMQGHELALAYLTETKFRVDVYLQIAQQYESDQTNPHRNTPRALEFYSRVVDLGEQKTALQLAQFYQIEHAGVKIDLDKAFDYYMKAARLGCQDAYAPLERLGEEMSTQKQMALSRMYGSFFNNEKATYWSARVKEVEGFELRM